MCIQNTDTERVPGHQLWAKIKLKFPTEFKVHFLYTISGVQFLLELKHSGGRGKKKKPQGQLLIASEKHYFYVSVCPKMNVLEGKGK